MKPHIKPPAHIKPPRQEQIHIPILQVDSLLHMQCLVHYFTVIKYNNKIDILLKIHEENCKSGCKIALKDFFFQDEHTLFYEFMIMWATESYLKQSMNGWFSNNKY